MPAACSRPTGPVLILAEWPNAARFIVSFSDGSGARDVSDWFCDLVLMGLHSEATASGPVEGVEQVTVAELTFDGGHYDDLHVYCAEPTVGGAVRVDAANAIRLASLGVASQLTDGIVADVAEEGPAPWNRDDSEASPEPAPPT